jgi:hypothetical protein
LGSSGAAPTPTYAWVLERWVVDVLIRANAALVGARCGADTASFSEADLGSKSVHRAERSVTPVTAS